MLRQVDRLVGDNLDVEILESRVQARVHVPRDIGLDQIGKIAACYDPNANERRQQRAPLQHHLLGKCIVEDEAAEVEQHLRQRQECQEPQQVQQHGREAAVRRPRIERGEGVLADFDPSGKDLKHDDDEEQQSAVQEVLVRRFHDSLILNDSLFASCRSVPSFRSVRGRGSLATRIGRTNKCTKSKEFSHSLRSALNSLFHCHRHISNGESRNWRAESFARANNRMHTINLNASDAVSGRARVCVYTSSRFRGRRTERCSLRVFSSLVLVRLHFHRQHCRKHTHRFSRFLFSIGVN